MSLDDQKLLGMRLRAERQRRGWLKPELARRLAAHITDQCPSSDTLISYIKRWEAGKTGISERYQLAYAAALKMDLDELFGPQTPAYPSLWRSPGLNGAFTPDDEQRLLLAATKPSRVDLAVVESLGIILAAQRRTEDVIGSAPLVQPVRAQLATIESLVREARGRIRSPIVNVAAQWAQFTGWLTANAGDVAKGRLWLDRALEWAVETDDVNLVGEVMSFKGHIAWMDEEVGPMIGLSAAALRGDGLYPGQYAISAAQKARGHAMVGDAYEAESMLDQADEHAAAARERADEAPPWLYYHSPGFFTLQRGLAYRYLGRYDAVYNQRAVDTLSLGLDGLPPDARGSEWAGEFVYQLGRAHLQDYDTDQARRRAADLAALADRIGSTRLADQARALR